MPASASQERGSTQFGTGVVGNEQNIGTYWEWRRWAELILPESDRAAAAQLPRHQADRNLPLAGRRHEFEVDRPHLAIWQRFEHWLTARAVAE